jgi:N-acetylneuraminic acid mutarotase
MRILSFSFVTSASASYKGSLQRSLHGALLLSSLSLLSVCGALAAQGQTREWVWMGGSDTMENYTQNFIAGGAYNEPREFAPGNTPGMREGAVTWTDRHGNLWLFGGEGADVPNPFGVYQFGLLNDLWEFDLSTNEWALMGGSPRVGSDCSYVSQSEPYGNWDCGVAGKYGTKGVAGKENMPGSREFGASWTDAEGNFWLFGGFGFVPGFGSGYLNDLWRFNPNTQEWTWMGGSDSVPGSFVGPEGRYGTKGQAASANTPGGRGYAAECTDAEGNFWLFGGEGATASSPTPHFLNDLWKYSPSTEKWVWVSGSNEGGAPGVYGEKGQASRTNYPGAREAASCWAGKSGEIWLFGGQGSGYLNDFWSYNPSNEEWTWVGGSDQPYSPGSYGNLHQAGTEFIPSARYEAARFTDDQGQLWLFGGRGTDSRSPYGGDLNDLWMFAPSTKKWTWMSGSKINNDGWFGEGGTYGVLGEPKPADTPGGRDLAATWTDRSGNLWLFSGEGAGANGVTWGYSPNDLWEYRLASGTPSATDTPEFSVAAGSYAENKTVEISDATPDAAIYYSTNASSSAPIWIAYTEPVEVTASETLTAIAIGPGKSPSAPQGAAYTLPTATPVIALPAGTYEAATVKITDATPGAVIYYTTNNTAPSTHSAVFSGQITLTASATVQAMAVAPGSLESAVATAEYAISPQAAATNQWTWMGGSSTLLTMYGESGFGRPGVYGTKGVPAKGNIPGGRYGAESWTDTKGNLWLFGGFGGDSLGLDALLNDLWKLNPATNEWAWMGGSSSVVGTEGFPGVYGTKGQFAAGNYPGSREFAATWVDKQGNFWMFGGEGFDNDYIHGENPLNDLWEFNVAKGEWAWVAGPENLACPGKSIGACTPLATYGAEGVGSPKNTPGGRWEAVSWVDSEGNLWMFGGEGIDSEGVSYSYLNELWKFDPANKDWTWMGGRKAVGPHFGVPGAYGERGKAVSGNWPGSRIWPYGWTDNSGNLWLFGGDGFDLNGTQGELNDLWEYSPASGKWTWISGSDTVGKGSLVPSVYGTLGVPAAENTPGGRSAGLAWKDKQGNAWLFGGYGADGATSGSLSGWLNDLWEFDPSTREWTWMGGSSQATVLDAFGDTGMPGAYGTLAANAAGNSPGAREYPSGWTDTKGDLWLFGGDGVDAAGSSGLLNDLWKLQPMPPAISAAEE